MTQLLGDLLQAFFVFVHIDDKNSIKEGVQRKHMFISVRGENVFQDFSVGVAEV